MQPSNDPPEHDDGGGSGGSPPTRRVRKCGSCGKPLGSTLGDCHECGGDSYRAGGPSEANARAWKAALGVTYTQIEAAHDGKFVGRSERL